MVHTISFRPKISLSGSKINVADLIQEHAEKMGRDGEIVNSKPIWKLLHNKAHNKAESSTSSSAPKNHHACHRSDIQTGPVTGHAPTDIFDTIPHCHQRDRLPLAVPRPRGHGRPRRKAKDRRAGVSQLSFRKNKTKKSGGGRADETYLRDRAHVLHRSMPRPDHNLPPTVPRAK